MLRPFVTLAAVGVAGFLIWNVLVAFLLPLLVGFVALAIKIAFIALLVFVLYRLLRRATQPPLHSS